MNRFLENLAVRLLNPAEAIQPRTPSRFEPESAAAPRPFSAPETVWEEAGGPQPHEPPVPEVIKPQPHEPRPSAIVSPEPDRPSPALSRSAPAGPFQPSILSEDAPTAPPTPGQAVRPAVPADASRPASASLPPGFVRDEARVRAPRPSAASASPVSSARQTVDVVPSVEAMPPRKTLAETDSPDAETQPVPAFAPPLALPAVRHLEGQAHAGLQDTSPAPPGERTPLSASMSPRPARVPASAEAAVSPGGAMIVEAVISKSGGDPVPPATGGRPPIPVVVRAAPAPASPIAAPVARVTPPPAPTIQVTIGRIEIRAAAPAPRASNARPAPPKLTLEEYLRDGGRK